MDMREMMTQYKELERKAALYDELVKDRETVIVDIQNHSAKLLQCVEKLTPGIRLNTGDGSRSSKAETHARINKVLTRLKEEDGLELCRSDVEQMFPELPYYSVRNIFKRVLEEKTVGKRREGMKFYIYWQKYGSPTAKELNEILPKGKISHMG